MNWLKTGQVNELLAVAPPGAVVYLVGAGGCGMSGLGHLLLDLGFRVAGSDLVVNDEVRQLLSRGARIHPGHAGEQVTAADPVLVVCSSAIRAENPELGAARERGVPIVRRAVLLAALLQRQRGICVAGMHGKTTTTALLAFVLQELGAAPSYAVGWRVPQLLPHARFSAPPVAAAGRAAVPPFFVVEADESDGTLHEFSPEHGLLLNLDAEHLDHYENIDAVWREFARFAAQVRERLVFCADDPRLAELGSRHPGAVSYGFHALAAYRCELTAGPTDSGIRAGFQVWHEGRRLGEFGLALLGAHNVANATAVVALLHQLGFPLPSVAGALARFRGVCRRQEMLLEDARFRVVDDYGHHPAEIRATLKALRELKGRRLLVAFQPHRFTRTRDLRDEFAIAFREADVLWLTEIYAASEPEIPGVSSRWLAEAIETQGQPVRGVIPAAELAATVRAEMQPGDGVVFLGAGADITRVAHELVRRLREERPRLNARFAADLAARLSPASQVRRNEPLARRTTLRVGGPADLYVEPATEADLAATLAACAAASVPVTLLGRGSNLLVRDGGIRGVVVCLAQPAFSRVDVAGERLVCGAGARLKSVAAEARSHGLSGLEFLEGIPGTVGGSLRMNAGAMGGWLFDVVERLRYMDGAGVVRECEAGAVTAEYRGCPLLRDQIALGVVLKGQPAAKAAIQARMDTFSRRRRASQPPEASAGCVFKNPAAGPAGRLIDELGLKGTRVGGAMVSPMHANFIVNVGTATAGGVLELIALVRQRARAARGVELETEVEIVGEG